MKILKLRKHGTYVMPNYVSSEGQSSIGESVDSVRPDGNLTGIVKRFSKTEKASDVTLSFDLIKTTYADAIEYKGIKEALKGIFLTLTASVAIMLSWGASAYLSSYENVDDFDYFIVGIWYLLGAGLFLWTARIELFGPVDLPIIFDRKNRKVYRIFREHKPGFSGIFRRWPIYVCEYEWDLIDAEHTAVVSTTGSTVMRHHGLVFLVRRSTTDSTIIDSFNIGSSMELGEATVQALWEHIRRFMEESGPHLPPSESLAPSLPPQTLWQSLSAVGPFGSNYQAWWAKQKGFMIVIHILFFVSVPIFLMWGFFNWLGYQTAITVDWPQEVIDAVGRNN